jgi:hypothetical protein
VTRGISRVCISVVVIFVWHHDSLDDDVVLVRRRALLGRVGPVPRRGRRSRRHARAGHPPPRPLTDTGTARWLRKPVRPPSFFSGEGRVGTAGTWLRARVMDAAGRDGAVATPARVTAPTKNADIAKPPRRHARDVIRARSGHRGFPMGKLTSLHAGARVRGGA